ncbi:cupin [bacterium I07]|nr:cupin [bacterium I07]
MTKEQSSANLSESPFTFSHLVDYQDGSIVSRTLIEKDEGTVTVFAFSKGQNLSEHTAPFDAMVQVLDGQGVVSIAGKEHELNVGDGIIMPANVPHAVEAVEKFKMLLTMVRSQ